jgi:hypothetical protein
MRRPPRPCAFGTLKVYIGVCAQSLGLLEAEFQPVAQVYDVEHHLVGAVVVVLRVDVREAHPIRVGSSRT